MIELNVEQRSKNVVSRIKKTLLKYDLEIARVEGEIDLCKETIDFCLNSSKRSDIKRLTEAKINKENYEVFLHRLKVYKNAIITKINIVASKYEKDYPLVFLYYFIKEKTIKEIAAELGAKESAIEELVNKMKEDLVDYLEK